MQLRYRENFSAPYLAGNSLPQKRAWEAGLGPPRQVGSEQKLRAPLWTPYSAAQSVRRAGEAGQGSCHIVPPECPPKP